MSSVHQFYSVKHEVGVKLGADGIPSRVDEIFRALD